jgi:uncharacterized protein (DUF983 family)
MFCPDCEAGMLTQAFFTCVNCLDLCGYFWKKTRIYELAGLYHPVFG